MEQAEKQLVAVQPGPVIKARFDRADLEHWHDNLNFSRDRLLQVARWVILFVFGFGGVWSCTVELGGAVISSGRVVAENHNRVIQHLEGGILADLLVREGEHVTEGQLLARLEDSQIRPRLENLKLQRAVRRIQLARRQAEIVDADTIMLPEIEESLLSNPRLQETIESQTSEFLALNDLTRSQIVILDNKIKGLEADIEGRKAVKAALAKQVELYDLELKDYKELLEKGLVQRTRVFATERQVATSRANMANTDLEIGTARNEIINVENQKSQVRLERLKQAEDISIQLQKELNDYESEISRLEDMLARTYLRAPTEGTIFRIAKRTIGAVVTPGEPLMEIVPALDDFHIEAQVPVREIEEVHVGQDVEVKFMSVKDRNAPPLYGKVTYVSSDAVVSETNPEGSYIAFIEIDDTDHKASVVPGNVATVFILTTPHTFFEMLIMPITRFTDRAFKG